jgi:thiosulfate dehydrogenase [quinone] large subunit
MLLLAIGLILAWKVAGWIGVDRYLLPLLGTPWHRGRLFQGGGPRGSTASPIGAARP